MANLFTRRRIVGLLSDTTVLIILHGATVLAQQATVEPRQPTDPAATDIRELSLAETIPFPGPVPTGVVPDIKCDSKGNIYILQTNMSPAMLMTGALAGLPVTKLSIDAKSATNYPTPTIPNYTDAIRNSFNTLPDGSLYMLLAARQASSKGRLHFFIAKFSSDGKQDTYFELGETRTGRFQPYRFAMFEDGHSLVSGVVGKVGEDLKQATAIFDRAGRFITYVQLSDSLETIARVGTSSKPGERATVNITTAPGAVQKEDPMLDASQNLTVSAADGYVYTLRHAGRPHIYAISSFGQVVRDFEIPVPASGVTAESITMTGDNMIAISFSVLQASDGKADATGNSGPITSVVSPLTGEVQAVYRAPDIAGSSDLPACAPSSSTFLYVGTTPDGQHQQVTRYIAR